MIQYNLKKYMKGGLRMLRKYGGKIMLLLLFLGVSAISLSSEHVKDVQAVTEVFGDGENLSAVILTYDKEIDAASLSIDDYEVPERTVNKVYVKTVKEKGDKSQKKGQYVVVELEQLPMVSKMADPNPQDAEARAKRNAMGITGPTLGSRGNPKPLKTFTGKVTQKGEVVTVDGEKYLATEEMTSSYTRQLVIEDFIQGIYRNPFQNGEPLMYNLYIPKDYDPKKKYPLVVFMHDAGVVSPEVKAALSQGLGAVAWADPSWQEKHPSFVLAPQYDKITVNDKFEYGPELDRTIHLINDLSKKYSIDRKRIYNTGQSMGGMSAISLDSRYPDFFAASYITASKWDVNVTDPMARQNVWFVASEGDPGAFPSLNAIVENLEKKGACVRRITVDAQEPQETVNSQIKGIIVPKCNIYHTVYKGGNHRYTWQYAYKMLPAMEWIFSKKK